MESVIDRHVFYISNSIVITAEVPEHVVALQFPVATSSIILPFVESTSRARTAKEQANTIYRQTSIHPLVFYSIVIPEIRDIILQSRGFCQDIVQALATPPQRELNLDPTLVAHRTHGLDPGNLIKYDTRIATIDYILAHDDGISLCNLDQAQVVLLGVSRCDKTPTSLYLVMQYSIRVANYPFIANNMDNLVLLASLKPLQYEIFGLTINPERLVATREKRREDSRYAFLRQCRMEVTGVEALYRKNKIPYLNNTDYSVEEIATKTMDIMGLNHRMY